MEKGQVLKDLPADVLMHIQSYFLGEPDFKKNIATHSRKYKRNIYQGHMGNNPSCNIQENFLNGHSTYDHLTTQQREQQ